MMKKKYFMFVLLLLPALVNAEWELEQSKDGHWISCQNIDQHQLVVSENANEKQFLLILTLQEPVSSAPTSAIFSIDNNRGMEYPLHLLKQRPSGLALKLIFDETEQDKFISQLVAGLKLYVNFGEQQIIDFTLVGFTDVFSNLLIANDIGRLDPAWLQSRGKKKELACYEISELSVQTIQMRRHGRTQTEVLAILTDKTSDTVEDSLPDIISWAYSMPATELPKIPMTQKYSFFKRCMREAKH